MANIKCEEHYCTNNINNICILESIELKKYSYILSCANYIYDKKEAKNCMDCTNRESESLGNHRSDIYCKLGHDYDSQRNENDCWIERR